MNCFKTVACCLSVWLMMACTNNASTSDGAEKDSVACSIAKQTAVVENIMSRRSIRQYKEQAVPREVLNEIMICGIHAPNGKGKQSWEIRIVDNPALQDEIKAVMAATGNERAADSFYNAPVWVFIARDKGYDFSSVDCGLLAQNIMLAANAMGIGSVCLGSPVRFIMNSPERDKVLPKLEFSEGYELCICIALGYPDEAPQCKPRDAQKIKFID